MLAKVKEIIERHNQITDQLLKQSVIGDRQKYAQLLKEHTHKSRVVEKYDELKRIEEMITNDRELLGDKEDPELVLMAKNEIESLELQRKDIIEHLKELLIPRDPLEGRSTIVEIRAGTGGDEAALFAKDLFRMYTR